MAATSLPFARGPLGFLTGRAGLFVVLAFLMAAQNTYASTLVASLFLARVGAHGIPLYYILFAVVSIPFAAVFSNVIDRFPRPRLFVASLAGFAAVTAAIPVLPAMGDSWPYAAYLIVRVFEHLLYSIYYILLTDYFSVMDAKRYAGRIALGMAVGGLIGGGLLTVVAPLGGPLAAAWVTPVLVALVLIYGGWSMARHRPLDAAAPAAPESLVESLRILPRLLGRYPLIALMSAAMFVTVLLQCVAEFLAFSIYTSHFPQVDELAAFLGLVNAGLSILGFLVIVLFTDRQLPRLGVPRMNCVYPAVDVVTFAALTLWPSLPAGILANMSYDPFEHGLDVPVTTMNYNAIRHRFVGRVRVFIDGMVFPLGLASAGILLLVSAEQIDLRLIAAFGLLGSLVLLLLNWNIGRQYAAGLVEMLRDGAVEFDTVAHGLRIPPDQVEEIRAMLAGDARTALIGLGMAARCDGEIASREISAALAKLVPASARGALAEFGSHPAKRAVIEELAAGGPPETRALAWEYLLSGGGQSARAQPLLDDPDEAVRCVAAAALLAEAPAHEAAGAQLGTAALSPAAALGAIEVLRRAGGRCGFAPLLSLGGHDDPAVRAAAVAAVTDRGTDDPALLDWARRMADDPEPGVRGQALALLATHAPRGALDGIAARFLRDPSPEVRHAGAQAIGARGEAAVPAICGQLRSDREEVQLAAVDALGAALGPAAGNRLFDELTLRAFAPIPFNQRLAVAYPPHLAGGPAIHAALDNARRRTLRLVMHVLDALGHRRTLSLVREMIGSRDERSRAIAIESLASLPQRRFVVPILPLIEGGGPMPAGRTAAVPDLATLSEALRAADPWLRAAAAVAWHAQTGRVPTDLFDDGSPIVAETARQLAQRPPGTYPYAQEARMSRLAFLHSVRLFADTSLDDLIAVDEVLGSHTYLAGEPIVIEGEAGDRLCIVHSGTVEVTKAGHRLARLGPGDFFGEMALFDDGPRSATVVALDDAEVLTLERDRFHSLVRQRPSVLMEVCRTLVVRLRQAEQETIPAE